MEEEISTPKLARRGIVQRTAPAIVAALVLVALAGCSVTPDSLGRLNGGKGLSIPSIATSPVASSTDAIQAIIKRANEEQLEAFSKHNPSIMKDTATADYYDQMVQINRDLATSGVVSMELVKIEWGKVSVIGKTTAQMTDYETWRTTYADGSSDQIRELNTYKLVQEQGAWKIQSDTHPNANPGHGTQQGSPI